MQGLLRALARRTQAALHLSTSDFVRIRSLSDGIQLDVKLIDCDRIHPLNDQSIQDLRQLFPKEIIDDFSGRQKNSTGFVAYSRDTAVGYIWVSLRPRHAEGEKPFTYDVYPADHQAYLYDLKIAPTARGRGLGAAMMSTGINWAIQAGAKSIIFTTGSDNHAVHRLTQILGFEDVGRIHFRRILGISRRDLNALQLATSKGG